MRLLLLAVVGLAACGDRPRNIEESIRAASELRRAERFDLALAKAEAALGPAGRSADPGAMWRLRQLKVDILLGHREAAQALSILDSYGDVPGGPGWAEQKARALLLRGQASYTLSRLPDADRF